jgi:Uma2 family endonuclease
MARASIQFTANDYRALPDTAPRMELLDGEFAMTPAPSPNHQTVVMNMGRILSTWLASRSIGKIFPAPCDVYLGESDVVQPDLLVLLNEHLDREREDGIYGAPDLTIEVLSKSTGALDLTKKREIYRRAGVPEYWAVDPASRSVTLYRLQEQSAPRTLLEEATMTSVLLPGFSSPVAAFFESTK